MFLNVDYEISDELCLISFCSTAHQYYKSLEIPSGSTYIHVTETTPSSVNYLAVKGQKSGTFINGNFHVFISSLANFTLAGSAWQYERAQNGAEGLKTDGPIQEDVLIYILALASYEGLSYSFSVPKLKLASLTYSVCFWNTSTWKSCDTLCGRGNQTRTVTCSLLSPGGIVETAERDSLCTTAKPTSMQECEMECGYAWTVSEWNGCNATCNRMGMRTRTVKCLKGRGDVIVGPVADHYCGNHPPSSLQPCRGEACQYGWKEGLWEECECGGWRERNVSCAQLVRGGGLEVVGPHLCENSSKPLTREKCLSTNTRNCSVFQWETSEWSEVRQERLFIHHQCNGSGILVGW